MASASSLVTVFVALVLASFGRAEQSGLDVAVPSTSNNTFSLRGSATLSHTEEDSQSVAADVAEEVASNLSAGVPPANLDEVQGMNESTFDEEAVNASIVESEQLIALGASAAFQCRELLAPCIFNAHCCSGRCQRRPHRCAAPLHSQGR